MPYDNIVFASCSEEKCGGWSGGGGGGCCWRHTRSNVSILWSIMTLIVSILLMSFHS